MNRRLIILKTILWAFAGMLTVMTILRFINGLGATTNLATAIKLAPEIAPKIRAYAMGFRYDAASGAWNKSEFNVRRDLNAADFLLNAEELELHIMTATVSAALTFDRDETFQRHRTMGAVGEYLTHK